MKRILYLLLAVCCALIAASCHKESAPVVTEPTIFDIMVEDYQALVKAFPLAKDNFVEARFVLNNEISTASAGSLKAESMEVICYTWIEGFSEIFVLDHDLTTGKTEMNHYSVDTPWTGDMKIPESEMQGLKVSLEEAIERAKKDPEAAAGDGLDTRYVTFRKPLWPVWPNPQYVIGGSAGRKNHVFVDSKTGDVVSLEAPVEEGTAKAFISEDYNMMIDQFGNFEIMGYKIEIHEHWVEAQYILNAPVNSRQASELFPKEVTYLFYAPGASKDGKDVMARGWRDFTAGPMAKLDMSMEELSSPWTVDKYIVSDIIDDLIGVDDAIYNLKISPVTDTDTPNVTLRWPAIPALEHPQYVFIGEKTKSVYVDAITGEVMEAK
ncbi:MAG: hypothetical protein J5886_00455 [Bacteroidales bacterium]|nr:hypothetical protein [Bacteroidales bacterium]